MQVSQHMWKWLNTCRRNREIHTGAATPTRETKATSTHTCQELKVPGLPDALHAFQLSGTIPLRNYYHCHFTNRETNKRRHQVCSCLRAQLCLTLRPRGLQSARLHYPWGFSSNTGIGCHALLQGIFLTQGMNSHFLYHRQILYHWSTGKVLCFLGPCKKPCFAPNSEVCLASLCTRHTDWVSQHLLSHPRAGACGRLVPAKSSPFPWVSNSPQSSFP